MTESESTGPGDDGQPLFVTHLQVGTCRIALSGDSGLLVTMPLPLGMTIDGIARTHLYQAFLRCAAAGHTLLAVETHHAAALQAPGATAEETWRALAADVWAAVDASGFRRTVFYGTLDGAYVAAAAAAAQPERTLGMILEDVPPAFGPAPGLPLDTLVTPGDGEAGGLRARELAGALGLDHEEAEAVDAAWRADRDAHEERDRINLLRPARLAALLPTTSWLTLVIDRVGPLAADDWSTEGWAAAIGTGWADVRRVTSQSVPHAIGAIQATLTALETAHGRNASRVAAGLVGSVTSAEQAVRRIRRVVVLVDKSPAAARTAELAARIAETQGAEAVVAAVVIVPRARTIDDPPPEVLLESQRAVSLGQAVVSRHPVACSTRFTYAREMVDGAIRVATEEHADLLIVSNPESEVEGAIPIGERMQELVSRAPCTVLINRGIEAL